MPTKKTAAKKSAAKTAPPPTPGVGNLCAAGRPLLAGVDVCRRCQVTGATCEAKR